MTGSDDERSTGDISPVTTILSGVLAWLLLGYVGFQYAGWTGAILLPIVTIFVMAVVFAPLPVIVLGFALIINSIKGCRAVKQRVLGDTERDTE